MNNILLKSESRYPVNRKKIKEKVNQLLAEKKVAVDVEVAVVVVGDRKMKALNKKYRQLEETTVVLAFPLDNNQSSRKFPSTFSSPDKILRLGDIVISYPQAVQMAIEENKLVNEKINELVEYGIQKLLGNF